MKLEHSIEGNVHQIGFPILFSKTQSQFRNFAPVLGADTEALLHEMGYTTCKIRELEATGVVKIWRSSVG